jgi:uncharacterized zinc-type alcohol dehydrogenase-like protein
MSSSRVLGYAARAVGQPLEPFTFEPPKLGAHDVRVSVTHCGVCHTDIHAIDNYYGITTFPFVPGHEIVGHVSDVGRAVSDLKEGDRVGVGWQGRSCMKCEWCLQGEEQLCTDIVSSGTWVLMCAGIAVYSPLQSYAKRPTQKIGIIGVGGLGHLALQFAHALDYEVTAISSSPEKKKQALAFGADHFIASNDQTSLHQAEFGFDLLLCTASGKINWEALLNTLKKNGTLVVAGFPDVSFNSTDLVAHQLSITGSFLGNRVTMREMLSFAQEHGIMPKVEVMPMTEVNDAIRKVKENKARYRIVLFNDTADTGR